MTTHACTAAWFTHARRRIASVGCAYPESHQLLSATDGNESFQLEQYAAMRRRRSRPSTATWRDASRQARFAAFTRKVEKRGCASHPQPFSPFHPSHESPRAKKISLLSANGGRSCAVLAVVRGRGVWRAPRVKQSLTVACACCCSRRHNPHPPAHGRCHCRIRPRPRRDRRDRRRRRARRRHERRQEPTGHPPLRASYHPAHPPANATTPRQSTRPPMRSSLGMDGQQEECMESLVRTATHTGKGVRVPRTPCCCCCDANCPEPELSY